MNALVWKAWRENRLYLAIFVAWMLLAACYTIGYQRGYEFRAPIGQFSSWASLYSICAAVILAVRVAQGERAGGTLGFSATLPISLLRTAGVRMGAAIVTLALPILLASMLLGAAFLWGVVEQAEPRPRPYVGEQLIERPTTTLPIALEHLASVSAIAILGGVQLLLVVSTLGCWMRSQAQVGLFGAVLAAISVTFSSALWFSEQPNANWQLALGAFVPWSLVVHWSYGAIEGGTFQDHELALYRWQGLLLAVPLQLLLGWVFATQYGRRHYSPATTPPRRRWLWMPAAWSYVPVSPTSPRRAMLWLELRQSLPLVTFGLLLALLIATLGAMVEYQSEEGVATRTRSTLPHTMAFIGMLWGAVVGAGLYSADLSGPLGSFWRSRPIPPRLWFWCKYFVGLFTVVVVLDGTAILAGWNLPHALQSHVGMGWSYVACFPILHGLLYTLALLGTCWLRKPVLGGFLAILAYGLLTTTLETFPASSSLESITVYNRLLQTEREAGIDLTRHNYPLVYGTLVLATILMAWLASRLARPLEQPHLSSFFSPSLGARIS